jgi:hypothetical protein
MRPILQIIQVNDIPHTLNGKRVEVPVKKVSYFCTASCRPQFRRDIRLSTAALYLASIQLHYEIPSVCRSIMRLDAC